MRPLLSRTLVTALLLTAAAAIPPMAAAAAATPAAPAAVRAATATAPVRITLVTGDTVDYARDSAGRASISVDLGPGREALTYRTYEEDTGYYVVPGDAVPYVGTGLLDRELFNLDRLAESGYTDAATGQLPVIVQYGQKMTASTLDQQARALDGGAGPRALTPINGAALRVDKNRAGAFWSDVRNTKGLRKVWLDARARVLDEASNAQIGAATAWAAGYDGAGVEVGIIDSGIDATHPDLAGKVVSARNFVPAGSPGGGNPDDVTDRHGHGTHVASTVAGTGAASGGRHRGVAPGARLIVAKALDNTGSAANSTIIAAMQWQAATAGAKIVSMSLGSGPTDGTDPVSQALNDLTARYGTLFVVAAGNAGPGRRTVAAPGVAASALTVGAVDGADKLADFSSRGPRLGADAIVKPEITAPGVGIVAGRAAGTSMGTPVGAHYTASSGTSMATPHVAAAAALLRHKHPDWAPDQLKNALVNTARDGGYTPYEQGAGRLDVARAVTGTVVADTATVFAGFTQPYGGPQTRRITYRNLGTDPVTLALTATVAGNGASPVAVSPASLTVPAGGTAAADLTIDPSAGSAGWFLGRLRATGGGADLAVPVAVHKQAPQATLTVNVIGEPGWAAMSPYLPLTAIRVNDTEPDLEGEPSGFTSGDFRSTGPNAFQVSLPLARGGVYSIDTLLRWRDNPDDETWYGVLTHPEVRMDADTTITLDARRMVPVKVETTRPSEQVTMNFMYAREAASGRVFGGATVIGYPSVVRGAVWALPTGPAPTVGRSSFVFDQIRIAPQVSLSLRGPGRLDLQPRYIAEEHSKVPKFPADRVLGLASQAELRAGQDLTGKLVLLERTALDAFKADLDRAAAAGAAGVLTNNHLAWVMDADAHIKHLTLPLLWLDRVEAGQVAQALAAPARPRAHVGVQLVTPYEYKLAYHLPGRVPDSLTFRPQPGELTEIDTTYHARFPAPTGPLGTSENFFEVNHTYSPGQTISIKAPHGFPGPARRVEYYNTTGPDVLWERVYFFGDEASGGLRTATGVRGFAQPTRAREDWNQMVLPGTPAVGPQAPFGLRGPCDGCRQGDRLRLRSLTALGLGQYVEASDPSHHYLAEPGIEELRLFRDGAEVTPEHDDMGLPYYRVPDSAATYRLTSVFHDGFPAPRAATTVWTTWTFRSAAPTRTDVAEPYICLDAGLWGDTRPCAWQPILHLRYGLVLAPDDTAPAGRFAFTVTAGRGAPGGTVGLSELRVWTSTDSGAHWTAATVRRAPGDAYRVIVQNPGGAGAVWLKAEARDSAGNTIHQQIADAYVVR